MSATVTLDADVVRWLVWEALDHVYDIDNDDEHPTCCASFCASCGAVMRLAADGQIDDIVRDNADSFEWWDYKRNEVDRELLERVCRPACEGCGGGS